MKKKETLQQQYSLRLKTKPPKVETPSSKYTRKKKHKNSNQLENIE